MGLGPTGTSLLQAPVPPDARGPLEVLVGTSRESWENSILDSGSNSSHGRVSFTRLIVTWPHAFFSDDVLRRN